MNEPGPYSASASDPLVISGMGMHSCFGGVVQAAAAFRCNLTRPQELVDWPYFDEETGSEQFIVGYPASGVTNGFQGRGRLLRMGAAALRDLQRVTPIDGLNASRLGILVAFSAFEEERVDEEVPSVLGRMWRLAQIEGEPQQVRLFFDGRTGILRALQEARKQIYTGVVDTCLIGTMDSLLDRERLYSLILDGRVKTVDNPVGFVPGEMSCFILVERLSHARRRGVEPQLVLHTPVLVEDPGTPEGVPPAGEALGETLRQALGQATVTPGEPGAFYLDMSGEVDPAIDFGNALVRLSTHYPVGTWAHVFPATSFGETGAASVILALCLATRAYARGYATGRKTVVVVSSEGGYVGALGCEPVG